MDQGEEKGTQLMFDWARPHLEVIDRDHEHANQGIVAVLIAHGLIVEKNSKLYVTLVGKKVLRHD